MNTSIAQLKAPFVCLYRMHGFGHSIRGSALGADNLKWEIVVPLCRRTMSCLEVECRTWEYTVTWILGYDSVVPFLAFGEPRVFCIRGLIGIDPG